MSIQSTLPACAKAAAGNHSDINITSTPIDRIITTNLFRGGCGRKAHPAPPGKALPVVFCIVPRAPVSAVKY
jgi:hypothetical protein